MRKTEYVKNTNNAPLKGSNFNEKSDINQDLILTDWNKTIPSILTKIEEEINYYDNSNIELYNLLNNIDKFVLESSAEVDDSKLIDTKNTIIYTLNSILDKLKYQNDILSQYIHFLNGKI